MKRLMLFLLICLTAFSSRGQTIHLLEYWFDADFNGRAQLSNTGSASMQIEELNTANLTEGLHDVHIRVKDSNGIWSVTHSQLFYKLPASVSDVALIACEYWVDNEFATRTTTAVSGNSLLLNSGLALSGLTEGLHKIHIRVKDENNRWSVAHSQLFYKLPASVSNVALTACEYWVDNEFATRTTTAVSGNSLLLNSGLALSGLTEGLHKIHIRVKDENNRWSVTHSQLFYKLPASVSDVALTACEYWVDNEFATRTTTAVSGNSLLLNSGLALSGLTEGLHKIHIRVKDENDRWSVTHSQLFYKLPALVSDVALTACEYWVDNEFATRTTTIVSGNSLLLNSGLALSGLTEGLHKIHIRVKDENDRWSVAHSQLFYKLPASVSDVALTACEYWVDNEFATRTATVVSGNSLLLNSGLALSGLTEGLHKIHIRVKDENNRWSVAHNQLFYYSGATLLSENKINAFRYWYDGLFTNQQFTDLAEPITVYNYLNSMDMPQGFVLGDVHLINFQFRDLMGKWSVVLTDTFNISTFTNMSASGFVSGAYPILFDDYIVLKNSPYNAKTNVAIYSLTGVCCFKQTVEMMDNPDDKILIGVELKKGLYILHLDDGIRKLEFKLLRN